MHSVNLIICNNWQVEIPKINLLLNDTVKIHKTENKYTFTYSITHT